MRAGSCQQRLTSSWGELFVSATSVHMIQLFKKILSSLSSSTEAFLFLPLFDFPMISGQQNLRNTHSAELPRPGELRVFEESLVTE